MGVMIGVVRLGGIIGEGEGDEGKMERWKTRFLFGSWRLNIIYMDIQNAEINLANFRKKRVKDFTQFKEGKKLNLYETRIDLVIN